MELDMVEIYNVIITKITIGNYWNFFYAIYFPFVKHKKL